MRAEIATDAPTMPADSRLTELTACPRCDKSPLSASDGSYECKACKTSFTALDGIPWLFAEPDASLGEWRNRLHFALQQLATDAQRMRTSLSAKDLRAATRDRLQKQLGATETHRGMLRDILAPLDIQSMQASNESYLALRTRLPVDQGIHTYYANIHRDWCWGDEENKLSLEQIRALSGEKPLGDTLVLGAGAARLAYDMHMQLDCARTVGVDFNPLLLLIAKAVMAGETLELFEFPLAPKALDDFAVKRELSAPAPVRDDFFLVFADGLRPPFGDGVFDTVVTPWYIDIVNEDLPQQAARINGLLQKGGRWINFGSLAFDHPDRARRYSAAEVVAIVEDHGFASPSVLEATIPYMCSPASRHARQETVFSFAAEKSKPAKKPPRYKALPDWLVTGKEAVPLTASFRSQATATQIHAYLMSLIDGKRTIGDMAKILEQQNLMTSQEAVPAIRTFFTRMYDDANRNSGF